MDNKSLAQSFEIQRPNNDANVGKFTLLAFLLASIATAGIIAGIIYHPLWYTACGASIAGAVMLTWRITEHDRRAFTIRRTNTPETKAQTITPVQPVVLNNNQQRLGRYKFTHDEWMRLATILEANDWRFVRDVVNSSGLFPSITKHWNTIKNEFERIGFVEDYSVTESGREWFSQLSPNLSPHRNGTG